MSFSEAIGKVLQGMGPGLLSGVGNALQPDSSKKPNPITDPAHTATPVSGFKGNGDK